MKSSQAEYAKTALRLPRDLHQAVHAVAKAQERTFNGQLIVLIRDAINRCAPSTREAEE